SVVSFFKGCRSTPGTIPATSQLDWLISITAINVASCSRATRDLLKSFSCGMGELHRFVAATLVRFPRRSPHSIYGRWENRLGTKAVRLRATKRFPVSPADIGEGLPDFRLVLIADIASKSTRRRPSADARASRPDAIRIERKCNRDEMRPPTRRPQRVTGPLGRVAGTASDNANSLGPRQ